MGRGEISATAVAMALRREVCEDPTAAWQAALRMEMPAGESITAKARSMA
jgi:hypothetical protein